MVARTGYFSYRDVREVLWDFDQHHFERPFRSPPGGLYLSTNQLFRHFTEHVPLEIFDYVATLDLKANPSVGTLWFWYIGTPSLKKRATSLQQNNLALNNASRMVLRALGKKPLKASNDYLCHFKQLMHLVFEDYFKRLNFENKKRVFEKFYEVPPTVVGLQNVLKIPNTKDKMNRIYELTPQIYKGLNIYEYFIFQKHILFFRMYLLRVNALASTGQALGILILAVLTGVILGIILLIYKRYIIGLLVLGICFPSAMIGGLVVAEKYIDPQPPERILLPLDEAINKFVHAQLPIIADKQLPLFCEKWERVVMELLPYASRCIKRINSEV